MRNYSQTKYVLPEVHHEDCQRLMVYVVYEHNLQELSKLHRITDKQTRKPSCENLPIVCSMIVMCNDLDQE